MLRTLAALSIAVLSITVSAKSSQSPSVLHKDWKAENPQGLIYPLPAGTKPMLVDDKTFYPEFIDTPNGVGIMICWEPVYIGGQPWCKVNRK